MKAKLLSDIIGLCILLGGLTATTTTTIANEKSADPGGDKKPAAVRTTTPFRGKIGHLDKGAKTMKVGARTFQVISDTKVVRDGKPSSFDHAMVGDEVGGLYREADGGKLEVVSLRLGPKPSKDEAPAKKEKEKEKEKEGPAE